jgi:hypothetical protein
MVSDAVFLGVGEVGVRRPKHLQHVVIVFGVLVSVEHHKADGHSRGLTVEHSAQQPHLIGLVARCGHLALSRSAACHLPLNKFHIDVDAGRHAVYHPAHGLTMTLAKGGEREDVSKCISHCLSFDKSRYC